MAKTLQVGLCKSHASPRRIARPHPAHLRCSDPPPAGEGKRNALSFSRRIARPRFADQSHEFFRLKEMKGGGAPVGATVPWGLATQRMLPSACASGEGRASSGTRSPFGAPPRRSTEAVRPRLFDSRPAFPGIAGASGRYPLFPVPVQRSTPRTGRNAGGLMPEAARERTVSVRARAPRPLPQSGAPS